MAKDKKPAPLQQTGCWPMRDEAGNVLGVRYTYLAVREELRAAILKWRPGARFTDFDDEVEVFIPA